MGTYDVNIDNRLTNLENEMLVAESYDTGWTFRSDWQSQDLTVTHNLNAPMSELVIKVFFSSNGTDANAWELIDGSESSVNHYGAVIKTTNNNSFYVQTGTSGIYSLDNSGNGFALTTQDYYWRVVVYKPKALSFLRSTLGSVGSYVYDTGWVANSDWTNADLNVTHNLNANLSDLIVKFFISTDGTEANSFEVGNDTAYHSSGDFQYGITFLNDSVNQFHVQTGVNGLYYIRDADGQIVVIDTESWYYKVKVYKPDVIDLTLKPTNSIYEINDANNINVAIPSVYDSSIQDEVFIKRVGTGSGVVNISFTSGQDGTSVSTLKGDGGYLHLINNGAKWYIKDYEDFEDISISSTGDSGNLIGRILYHSNGECEFLGKCNPTTNVSAGNAWTGEFDLSSYFDSIREGGNISPDRANGASFARKMYNFGLNLHSNIGNGSIEIGFYTYDSDTYTNSISYYFGVHVIGRWK